MFDLQLEGAIDGDRTNQYQEGMAYLHGSRSAKKDIHRAHVWLRKAAEQGHGPAQYMMGLLYQKGEGTYEDLDEAFNWYEKSASHGDSDAINALGKMYRDGKGCTQDAEKAKELFRQAADLENEEAVKNLAAINRLIFPKNTENPH